MSQVINSPSVMSFSLKVEYERVLQEKAELQRAYMMYYEITYTLNFEMQKQVMLLLVSTWLG